ncbi:MAG: NHL repeat-containing protein [Bacteroidota bacterium]
MYHYSLNFKSFILFILFLFLFFTGISQSLQKIAEDFNNPTGLCINSEGNIYIADYGNHVIKKISLNGNINIIAGTGIAGYSGDGGAANEAELNFPYRLCVDKIGNIYFSDHQNNVIRKISTNGIISTIAGNGSRGYSGDEGPAIEAQLNNPMGIHIDSDNNIYIADAFNQRIRKVTSDGIISTIAGSGAIGSYNGGYSGDGGNAINARLNLPIDLITDSIGNLFIVEEGSSIIRKINANGVISTYAGKISNNKGYSGDGGSALDAQLNNPLGIGIDGAGNIYVTDESNFVIRKITSLGIISTIAGNGQQGVITASLLTTHISLGNPNGISVLQNGEIYFTDNSQNKLYKITN